VAARTASRAHIGWSAGLLAAALVLGGCGSGESRVTIRNADDVQVMSPAEVKQQKAAKSDDANSGAAGAGNTVPQNEDKRPIEARLFESFGMFRKCIAADGEGIKGDLTDRNNPAYKDPAYVKTVQKCAARSKIAEIYQEFQSIQKTMTPDQVKERNESLKKLQPCLEKKGWTIETTTNEIGLITPTKFQSADGQLNERDIAQCASDVGIDGDALNG
jgi:hypothetical protein